MGPGLGATIVDQIGAKASLDLDATINKGTSKSSSSKPTTIRLPESECQVGMIRKHCFRVCPATCSHAATCRAVQCSRKGRCMCRGGLVQATISYPILGCVPKILCPVFPEGNPGRRTRQAKRRQEADGNMEDVAVGVVVVTALKTHFFAYILLQAITVVSEIIWFIYIALSDTYTVIHLMILIILIIVQTVALLSATLLRKVHVNLSDKYTPKRRRRSADHGSLLKYKDGRKKIRQLAQHLRASAHRSISNPELADTGGGSTETSQISQKGSSSVKSKSAESILTGNRDRHKAMGGLLDPVPLRPVSNSAPNTARETSPIGGGTRRTVERKESTTTRTRDGSSTTATKSKMSVLEVTTSTSGKPDSAGR
ncbi:unnamed protein product [Nippostrongylus brasiliensis]|uniref:Uncharacterized protein n=1 Tax=Nippostrongylus brasiliensis TaxID=27835 RepID=A0A0N4YHB3_NIPBR|nr:unnamed protein product [Nippostrongylus brasiliensis]